MLGSVSSSMFGFWVTRTFCRSWVRLPFLSLFSPPLCFSYPFYTSFMFSYLFSTSSNSFSTKQIEEKIKSSVRLSAFLLAMEYHSFKVTLMVRFLPIPFGLQNALCAVCPLISSPSFAFFSFPFFSPLPSLQHKICDPSTPYPLPCCIANSFSLYPLSPTSFPLPPPPRSLPSLSFSSLSPLLFCRWQVSQLPNSFSRHPSASSPKTCCWSISAAPLKISPRPPNTEISGLFPYPTDDVINL